MELLLQTITLNWNLMISVSNQWNPGYINNNNIFVHYEKKWFCNTNKIIHQNEKELNNCQYCTE